MDGEKPTDGKIIFSNGKVTVTEELVFGNSFLAPTVTLSSLCGEPISYTTEGQLTLGDKYQCKVKDKIESPYEDGYYFYVLSYNNADGTVTKYYTNAVSVNLIMDQNINSDGTPAGMTGVTQATNQSQYNLVAWNSEDGRSINVYGPVTAMEFLHKATIGWTNIVPLNYIYNDRETQNSGDGVGYTSFVSTNGIATITPLSESDAPTIIGTKDAPLRSRMPIYSSDVTKTEVADHNANNGYLYDNLDLYGMNPPYAYLTLSSHADYSSDAWYVTYLGSVYNNNIYIDDGYGVRPVITVELD